MTTGELASWRYAGAYFSSCQGTLSNLYESLSITPAVSFLPHNHDSFCTLPAPHAYHDRIVSPNTEAVSTQTKWLKTYGRRYSHHGRLMVIINLVVYLLHHAFFWPAWGMPSHHVPCALHASSQLHKPVCCLHAWRHQSADVRINWCCKHFSCITHIMMLEHCALMACHECS